MDNLERVAQHLDVTFLETTPTGEHEQRSCDTFFIFIFVTHAVAAFIRPEEIPFLQMLAVSGELLTTGVRNKWADALTLVNV